MQAFVIGKEYPRCRLLSFVGSRQGQSGVIWGPKEHGCVICTSGGRHGKKAGYSDEALEDGSWWYFGQGTRGDQVLKNSANSKLASGELSVLLFKTREPTSKEIALQGNYGKFFNYCGLFNVSGHETFIPSEGNRTGDRLIRFRLIPVANSIEDVKDADLVPPGLDAGSSMHWLRVTTSQPVPVGLTLVQYRKRCAQIRMYAKLRANGLCESCGTPAPFVGIDKTPFLEVHHLIRLADEGPDEPQNVCALCPNCHRHAHFGVDRSEFNDRLLDVIRSIEEASVGL